MYRFHAWLFATLLLVLAAAGESFAALVQQRVVLFVSPDDLSFPHPNAIYNAFQHEMKGALSGDISIQAENLDLIRFTTPEYRTHLRAWLEEKYRGRKIEALFVYGHGPLKFLLEARPQLWPDVPIVFTVATRRDVEQLQVPPSVTGKTIDLKLGDMVGLAKSVLPGTRKLVLVGNAPERDNFRPFFAPELAALSHEIEFIDLRGKPLEDVLARVANLPPDSVIYNTAFSDDGTGRVFVPLDALARVSQAANRPILSDNWTSNRSGILGGLGIDPAVLGHEAAVAVKHIMGGQAPAAIPIGRDVLRPTFDWMQLKRWQIATSRVPSNGEILNYQPGLWEKYRWQLGAVLFFIALQSVMLALLLIERRRRARAVSDARRRLAELAHMNRNATASVYSAAIAHELNQPLAAILSNAEAAELFLKMKPPQLREVQDILVDIRRDDQRARDLIQRMRGLLTKSESVVEIVDIRDVVNDALKFLASEAKARGVTVTADLAPRGLMVPTDRVQIQQVVINLVINSMDAMIDLPAGRRIVTVRTFAADTTHVTVEVSDTGTGFDANVAQVFDSFFTTKSHGMGLGLSITAAIVAAHGGTITAENAMGGGALVRFTLLMHARLDT